MDQKSYDLILGMLEDQRDIIYGSILYIDHQLALPEKHRVEHTPEEEMEENLKTLKINYHGLEQAISQFKDNREVLLFNPGASE